MQEVTVHIPSNVDDDMDDDSKSSSQDTDRNEEVWREKNELFFRKLQAECKQLAKQHDIASHKNKKRYIYSSIPSTVLPLVLANVSVFCETKYVDTIGLTVVSVINGLQVLLNFGKKKEIHNQYASKYMELSNDIDKVLVRGKRYRETFDVVLERITAKKQAIDADAPYL